MQKVDEAFRPGVAGSISTAPAPSPKSVQGVGHCSSTIEDITSTPITSTFLCEPFNELTAVCTA